MHRNTNRSIALYLLLAAVLVCCPGVVRAAVAPTQLSEKLGNAIIDWGGGFYFAAAEGVEPSASEQPNRVKAYLKAKNDARAKAVDLLFAAVEKTPIDCATVGLDYLGDDARRTAVLESLRRAEVASDSEKTTEQGSTVRVTLRAPMYGRKSPGAAFLDALVGKNKAARAAPAPNAAPARVSIETPAVPAPAGPAYPNKPGPYTSCVIDARGLKLQCAVSPKIRGRDGGEIWGTIDIYHNLAFERGIVAYTRTVDEALKNQRAGANPLYIRAIGRAGAACMCDSVVSEEDARRLVDENSKSEKRFLDRCLVIFIVDPADAGTN